jgi:hypothetical protein
MVPSIAEEDPVPSPAPRAYAHLIRLAAVFAVAVAAFLVLRWMLVPADYGRYGAYRAGAITLNQARPISYAGQVACVECHSDVADTRKGNAHEKIGCESCHGPNAKHAANPENAATKPDPRATCAVCHTPNPAKPVGFKTVDFNDHAGPDVACTECHKAHAPRF